MKNEFGTQPLKGIFALFSPRIWRPLGIICIFICAVMAWYGVQTLNAEQSMWHMLFYWGAFLAFLVLAMLSVLFDVRYIRMQYAMARRKIFEDTLGDEDFRRQLRANQEKKHRDS